MYEVCVYLTERLSHVLVQVDRVSVLHELSHHLTLIVFHHQHLLRFCHAAHHQQTHLKDSERERQRKRTQKIVRERERAKESKKEKERERGSERERETEKKRASQRERERERRSSHTYIIVIFHKPCSLLSLRRALHAFSPSSTLPLHTCLLGKIC